MGTIFLTIMATLFSLATVFITCLMWTNTNASATARWAVGLWLATVSVLWWLSTFDSIGIDVWHVVFP